MIEEKIKELTGYELPAAAKPLAAYVPARIAGNMIFTAGQLPTIDGKLIAEGKVDAEVTVEKAAECARIAALNCLSVIKAEIGSLEKIKKIVKLTVFVNSSDNFTGQPKVANGASDFLINLFGDKGKHARSAVGVNELPINAPVEIEMIAEISE
ncbi:Endoribonuclease L-PSP [Melioribacter roseus P3M-2]|uniref:Endoribonuclease L-PSP n=1 Tax=Melioribacter roseus (strain DSM 23840 / JCM 17771 / VKM B-2668 / P3M-2) TaxID=1191523 RepID=I6ZU42_MELRP|nr:RidA family protein [Melioribacter roseus]AFN75529.1 Endoribonuclease L-PSP [Melioribacter roseus P3M-2]